MMGRAAYARGGGPLKDLPGNVPVDKKDGPLANVAHRGDFGLTGGYAGGGRTTPSGGVKASYRHKAESHGHTMPGGGFPIEDAKDLSNAKHDVGRASDPAAARRWINKRAGQLGEPKLGED